MKWDGSTMTKGKGIHEGSGGVDYAPPLMHQKSAHAHHHSAHKMKGHHMGHQVDHHVTMHDESHRVDGMGSCK